MLSILASHEEEVLRAQDAVHDPDGESNLAGSSHQHRTDPHDQLMDSMTMNLGGLASPHHSLPRRHIGNTSLVDDVLPELYIRLLELCTLLQARSTRRPRLDDKCDRDGTLQV
ncbi:hypothetical protein FS749_010863 [Ceratobasidium sp. UAMH 11750]|nr:hypothetical protein FS749_010863 [Ceratobasidium sp. UAMH 11750]